MDEFTLRFRHFVRLGRQFELVEEMLRLWGAPRHLAPLVEAERSSVVLDVRDGRVCVWFRDEAICKNGLTVATALADFLVRTSVLEVSAGMELY